MAFNKVQNMLLGIAIGDAFGAGYEFLKGGRQGVREAFDFTKYRKHPIEISKHTPGMYTDDTQMSIAVCELLLSGKKFAHEALAGSFVDCYKRDPIEGYSSGFKSMLDSVSSGKELFDKVDPNSKRNGAAMRSVPLGVLPDPEAVVEYAIINAEVTHNTLQGIASSACVGLASHYFFHEIKDVSLLDFLEPHCRRIHPGSADHFKAVQEMEKEDPQLLFGADDISEGVPCDGMRTAGAALYVISRHGNSASETLKNAVLLGGDTDSVASIALGIAAMKAGISDLPRFLLDDLTGHKFGKDYLISLGEGLSAKYK